MPEGGRGIRLVRGEGEADRNEKYLISDLIDHRFRD